MADFLKYHRENYHPLENPPLDIDAQVFSRLKPKQDILEIGCASGYFGQAIREHYGSRLWGVEKSGEAAALAKPYYEELFVGDIEKDALRESISRTFDVVLLMAVLYALRDPIPVLQWLKGRLRPGGGLILTVPNIANWRVRWQLCRGRFKYEPYGLLDESTSRFYTRRSTESLLQDTGWRVIDASWDPDAGCPLLHGVLRRIPYVGYPFLRRFYGMAPDFWGYQFLFQAVPA